MKQNLSKAMHLSSSIIIPLLLLIGCSESPGLPTSPKFLTYQSQDGTLVFNYPEGWVLQEDADGLIALGTPDTALMDLNSLAADQLVVYIGAISPEGVAQLKDAPLFTRLVKNDPPKATEMLNLLVALLTGSDQTWIPQGDLAEITVGDHEAARAYLVRKTDVNSQEGIVLQINFGNGGYVTLRAITPLGSLPMFEDTLLEIARSVEYTP